MSSVRLCLLEMSRKLQQHGCLNKDLNKRDREIGGYMETVGEMKGKCDIIIFNSSKRKKEIQKILGLKKCIIVVGKLRSLKFAGHGTGQQRYT